MKLFSSLGQETFKLITSRDWSDHALGSLDCWNPVLIHSLNTILNSFQPSFIFWGKEAFCFYNDGYISILGNSKHPHSLGSRADVVWKEIWNTDTNPQYQEAMGGSATWNVDKLVPIERNGKIEQAYFTYGYSPIYLDDGSINGVLVTAVETTSSVLAKKSVDITAEQLGKALEVLKTGFYDWDMTTDNIIFNSQMQEDWGIKADTSLAGVFESIHPEDRERVTHEINSAIENKTSYHCTYRVLKGNSFIWIEARGSVSYVEDKAVRFFGTSIDITEKYKNEEVAKRLTNELAIERSKLEAIFQETPAALALWAGEDLVFEKTNPAYKAIFPGRELKGPFLEAVPEFEGQGFDVILRKVLHTGTPFIGKEIPALIPNEKGDLEKRYYDFSYVQVSDSEGKPYGVYDHAVDVTERVNMTLEKENSILEMQSEKNFRETFVAALTHDLRTPIASTKIVAQGLDRLFKNEKAKSHIDRIIGSMDRADKMIEDILDLHRLKAGEVIYLDKTKVEFKELFVTVLEDFTRLHGERFLLDAPHEIQGLADAGAIKRILENILSNAVKYGEQNSKIEVSLRRNTSEIEFSVKNYGNPISENQFDKIFEAYHRVNEASTIQQQGWGIGLTLVKGLVEAHEGRIEVTSSKNNGTVFTVNLPG